MRVRYSFSSRKTGLARNSHTNKHKVAFPKLAKEVIRISDIVLEVLDARFIEKTRNKDTEKLVKDNEKVLVYIINKSDLVSDIEEIKKELDEKALSPNVIFSCKSSLGRFQLRKLINIIVKKGKFSKLHKKAHVGVIGYPNTGKSSLINAIAGGGRASASPESGFTKGVRRIRFNKNILILDTPGVFQEDENIANKSDLKKHAEISSRNFSSVRNPEMIVHNLISENPELFDSFYKASAKGDSELLLETLGKKKGFLQKGNKVNTDKTSRYILRDWQEGKISKNQEMFKSKARCATTP